jgi:hypothetical protein
MINQQITAEIYSASVSPATEVRRSTDPESDHLDEAETRKIVSGERRLVGWPGALVEVVGTRWHAFLSIMYSTRGIGLASQLVTYNGLVRVPLRCQLIKSATEFPDRSGIGCHLHVVA